MNTVTVNPTGIFDDPKYAALALENSEKYQKASPFPHIVLNNFIDLELARELARECPKHHDINWVESTQPQSRKRYQHDDKKFTPLIRMMLRELNSRQFLLFLETLTGIENLIPDPYYIGGGVHSSVRGDFLKVHADFNWHHKLLAHRRMNALLYLNEGWDESWGGHLELWNKEMTKPEVSIAPIMNRLVVFNTTEDSNHGVPQPLTCPEGVQRITLNLYYYTTKRDETEINDPHFTKYKTVNSPFAVGLGEEFRKSAEEIKKY
jgi:Rps23 Pro-64 3,4-dihydroxylase Tpa1-like proline 4-hydroxylase